MKQRSTPGFAPVSRVPHSFDPHLRPTASSRPLLSSASSSSSHYSAPTASSSSPGESRGEFALLQQDIEHFLSQELPDETHRRSVAAFIGKLEAQIQEQYPNAELKTHGSGACGLATKTSDVDLVLSGVQPSQLVHVFDHLSQLYPEGCAEGVFSAKIPIIRILDPDSGQDADISVAEHNSPNVDHDYRTRLLRSFTKLDPRVVALIILVKKWSKLRDIGEARFGFLGSFGYSLSVINFLQTLTPPVLPCLHVRRDIPSGVLEPDDVMSYREYVPLESFQSKNTQSVASLLLGFFEWFSGIPSGTAGTISVRCGGVVNGSFTDMEVQKQKRCVCIEDPYQPDLNVGKGVSMEKALMIKKECRQWAQYMKDTRNRIRLAHVLIPVQPNPRAAYDHGKAQARLWSQRKTAYRRMAAASVTISKRRALSPVQIESFESVEEDVQEITMPYGPSMKSQFTKRPHPYARPASTSRPAPSSSSSSSSSSGFVSSAPAGIQTLSSRFSQHTSTYYSESSYSQRPAVAYYAEQPYLPDPRYNPRMYAPSYPTAFGFAPKQQGYYSSAEASWTAPEKGRPPSNRRVVLRTLA